MICQSAAKEFKMDIEIFGYEIRENGDVIGKRTQKPMKFSDNGKGYMISCISVMGKPISITHHRVVAYKFLGKCPEGYEVGHKDDNRSNNHPNNLEYVTKSQNNQQRYDRGNRSATGANNANAKLTEAEVITICKNLQRMYLGVSRVNLSELSRKWGISRVTLSAIKNRKQWTEVSKNYTF